MSIRLNKALRELNIGLQTAVEFLEKKSELGEVKAEPSFKLNDEQYAALVEAFKQDAAVRSEAEKLFKKPKEKKRAQEPKREESIPRWERLILAVLAKSWLLQNLLLLTPIRKKRRRLLPSVQPLQR